MKRVLLLGVLCVVAVGLRAADADAQAPKGNLPPHQAVLSWTAGANSNASNVYRCPGVCTATSGTFTLLNSTPLASATSYTDTAVVASTTYSWCVTAVDTTVTPNLESACSNIVNGAIPADKISPPTSVVIVLQ